MDSELRAAVRTLAFAGRGLERNCAPLTLPQYRVLAMVAGAPERASRVAAQVDVAKASLTGVLDALEGHGWVERRVVDGDRRGVSLVVTPAGAAVLAEAEASLAAWLGAVLDAGGPGERRAILSGIDHLGSALAARRATRVAQ